MHHELSPLLVKGGIEDWMTAHSERGDPDEKRVERKMLSLRFGGTAEASGHAGEVDGIELVKTGDVRDRPRGTRHGFRHPLRDAAQTDPGAGSGGIGFWDVPSRRRRARPPQQVGR